MDPSNYSPSWNGYEDRSPNENSYAPSTFPSQHRPSLHHSRSLPLARLSSTPSPLYPDSAMSSEWTAQAELGTIWRDEETPGRWAGEHYDGVGSSYGGYDDHRLAPPLSSTAQGSRMDFLAGRSSSSGSHYSAQNSPSPSDDSPYISWHESLSRSSTPPSDTFPTSPSSYLQPQHIPPPPPTLHHPLSQSNLHYFHESDSPASIAAPARTSQPELRNASISTSSSSLLPHLSRQSHADGARRGSLPPGSRFAGGQVVSESHHPSGGGGGGGSLSRGIYTLRQAQSSSDATVRRGSLPDGLTSTHIALPPSAAHPSLRTYQHPYEVQTHFGMDTFDAQPAQSRSFGNRRIPLHRSVSDSSSPSNNGPIPLASSSPTSQYPGDRRNLPSSLSALSVHSPTSMNPHGGGGLQLQHSPSNEVSPPRPCFPVAEEEEVPMQTEGLDGEWKKASHPLHHQNSKEKFARSDAPSVPGRHSHWPAPISTTTTLRDRAFSTASSSSSSGISTPNYHLSPGVAAGSTLHTVPSVLYSFSPSNEGKVPSPHYTEYQHQQRSSMDVNSAPPQQDPSTFRTRAKRSASAPGPSLLSIRETSSFASSNNDPMITDAPKPIESSAVRHIAPELVLGRAQRPAEEDDDGLESESESEEEDDEKGDETFVEKESGSTSTDHDEEMMDERELLASGSRRAGLSDDSEGEEEIDQDQDHEEPTRTGRARKRNRSYQYQSASVDGNRFPDKLYKMANAPSSRSHVQWSAKGDSVIIPDPEGFASAVLHRYFKHDKLTSFLRQLNIYGFTRVRNAYRDGDGRELKEGKKSLDFSHPNFLRGRKDLVALVIRNSSSVGRSKRKETEAPPPPAVVDPPSPVVVELEFEDEHEPEPDPKDPTPPPPPPPPPAPPPLEPLTYEELESALVEANATISAITGHLKATDRRRIDLEQITMRLKMFVLRRVHRDDLSEIADLFNTGPTYSYSPNRYPPTSAPHSQSSFNLSIPSHQPLPSAPTPSPTLSSYSGDHQVYANHSSSSSAIALLAPPSSINASETSPSSAFFAAHGHNPHQLDGSFSPTKRPRLSPGGGVGLVHDPFSSTGEPSLLLSPSEKTPTSQHASGPSFTSSTHSRPVLPRKPSSKTLRVGNVGGSSLAVRRRTSASSSKTQQQQQRHSSGPVLNFGGLDEQPSHGVKVEVEEMDDDLMGDALKGVYK